MFFFSLRPKPSVSAQLNFENAQIHSFYRHLILKMPKMIPFLPILFFVGLKTIHFTHF